MNRATQKGIRSAFVILLQHMLKIAMQPEKHTLSWNNSIRDSQEDVLDDIKSNRGLGQHAQNLYEAAYPRAKRNASAETGITENRFPATNPWSTWQEATAYVPPDPP